jgi:hypothetical protein
LKTFFLFLAICIFIGLFLGRMKPAVRTALLLLLCVAVSVAYFFFNKI